MWDYLVRILHPEDVPRRPLRPEFPHAAVEPEHTRTATEASPHGASHAPEPRRPTAPLPVRYCPVCHVRMTHAEWRGVECLSCPECDGMFFSLKSLEQLAGESFAHQKDVPGPIVYTPEGVLDKHRRRPRP